MSGKKLMMILLEQLKEHEGFRGNYYLCTANKKTIGYGLNVDNNPFSNEELKQLGRCEFDTQPMTKDEAEVLLENDIDKVIVLIKDHLPWDALCEARKAVCANMAFNLGVSGFFKFKNMISAINKACFIEAAAEMANSRWAQQVGYRADCLVMQMATGKWQ